MLHRIRIAVLAVSLGACAWSPGEATAASLLADGPSDGGVIPDPSVPDGGVVQSSIGVVEKQILVDGRPATMTLLVQNVWFTQAPGGTSGTPVTTNVRVGLLSADAQPLPAIRAVRVKLERAKPPVRIYRAQLAADGLYVDDPNYAGFSGVLTTFRPGMRLKATVTIVTATETRIVRIGDVRVRPLDPLYSGSDPAE